MFCSSFSSLEAWCLICTLPPLSMFFEESWILAIHCSFALTSHWPETMNYLLLRERTMLSGHFSQPGLFPCHLWALFCLLEAFVGIGFSSLIPVPSPRLTFSRWAPGQLSQCLWEVPVPHPGPKPTSQTVRRSPDSCPSAQRLLHCAYLAPVCFLIAEKW